MFTTLKKWFGISESAPTVVEPTLPSGHEVTRKEVLAFLQHKLPEFVNEDLARIINDHFSNIHIYYMEDDFFEVR